MPEFENYAAEAAQLETEIARKGVVLGIDWNNEAEVRKLARHALASLSDTLKLDHPPGSQKGMATLEIIGLSQLMLKVMKQSADEGILTHGGPVWKSLGRALWEESHNAGEHK
ncbi:MAG: hypothetical protein WAO76_16540 [Georgfuchsia sp.]